MKTIRRALAVTKLILPALVVVVAVSSVAADVAVPYDSPVFRHEYDIVYDRAILRGRVAEMPPAGPWWLTDFAAVRDGLDTAAAERVLSGAEEGEFRLFGVGSERLQTRSGASSQDLLDLSAGLRYEASSRLGALIVMSLDREKALDPDYIGKKWRGLAGSVQSASLYFRYSDFKFTIGRQRVWWGPRPTNLVLSATAEPMDMLAAEYARGRLHFNFIFARLDGSRPDSLDRIRFPDYDFASDNRYLVGHRLDLRLHRSLRVGLFETSVFGGVGRPPELYYLNPLQFFHAAQLNENVNDNTFLGADLTWLPGWNLMAWGQLLVDDFQIDDKVKGDQEPNELGLMIGLKRAARIGSWLPGVDLEYTRITNRTYHQLHPRNRYLYRNQPLGHPLGMDADSLAVVLSVYPSRSQRLSAEVAYSRHGQGSLYGSWNEPWLETSDDYSESFPTGIVQRGLHVAVRAAGYLPICDYTRRHLYISLGAGWADYENRYHIEGQGKTDKWLKLSISWLGGVDVGLEE